MILLPAHTNPSSKPRERNESIDGRIEFFELTLLQVTDTLSLRLALPLYLLSSLLCSSLTVLSSICLLHSRTWFHIFRLTARRWQFASYVMYVAT